MLTMRVPSQWIAAVGSVIVGLVIVSLMLGPDVGSAGQAIERCKEFVLTELVAPATAIFSSANDIRAHRSPSRASRVGGEWTLDEPPKGRHWWSVSGYVDSQNGFGALIRSNFVCQLSYLGNGRWILDELLL